MKMRHELKYIINHADYLLLKNRLSKLFAHDKNASEHGEYHVRSFYFETPNDHVLLAKINGVDRREKFRLRMYNGDTSFIRLEKKIKQNGLCAKRSVQISREQVQDLLGGKIEWLREREEDLFIELYSKMRGQALQLKTIVEYIREPFIFPAGNVRITLDRQMSSGLRSRNFLDEDLHLVPTFEVYAILEVKYDHFLPDIVKEVIQISGRPRTAFSKYAVSRKYD